MSPETQNGFFVFEGMDGVGKSTAAEAFADRIGAVYLETPGPGIQQIRGYVDADIHTTQTKFLLYLGSVSAVADRIESRLADGEDVVLDRYFPTTVVYNNATRDDDHWYDIADRFDFLEPDEMFYLWTDEETRRERMYGREEVGHRKETDEEFMLTVRNEYDRAAERYGMTPIEAVDGVDRVVDALMAEVEDR